jgi:hypothetical protein
MMMMILIIIIIRRRRRRIWNRGLHADREVVANMPIQHLETKDRKRTY